MTNNFVAIKRRQALQFAALCFTVVLASVLIYLPGIHGPFIFDDVTNLLSNEYIKLKSLTAKTLYDASFSMSAGPLRRPITMLSFALNYYAAGGFDNSTFFKATNIAIHAFNALLVFWLARLLFARATTLISDYRIGLNAAATTYVAWIITLLWAVHPIQLTSVLYVVQRMTSLAALFTLLGLIAYVKGRSRQLAGQRGGAVLVVTGLLVGTVLATLCKEIGILLPLFAFAIETTLFRTEWPWSEWGKRSPAIRRAAVVVTIAVVAGCIIWVVDYASYGYSVRSFTMMERTLTEARVLWFYLSLIVVPSLQNFGLNHDDIVVSTSIFDPWTTLPAVLGLAILFMAALAYRKRYPLLSLGILWFFAGHALESTLFSLELVYEHRNYLPSLGVILIAGHFTVLACSKLNSSKAWFALAAFCLLLATVTTLRSGQWSDMITFAQYETKHHPQSPRAAGYLAQALAERRQYDLAVRAFRRAAELDKTEPAYLMAIHLVPPHVNLPITPRERIETIQRLVSNPITASSALVLQTAANCVTDECKYAQKSVESWARALLSSDVPRKDNSFCYYLLGRSLTSQGRTAEALSALSESYALDPQYLHPRIDAIKLLLSVGRLKDADREMSALRAANAISSYPHDAEVTALSAIFDDLRQRKYLRN